MALPTKSFLLFVELARDDVGWRYARPRRTNSAISSE